MLEMLGRVMRPCRCCAPSKRHDVDETSNQDQLSSPSHPSFLSLSCRPRGTGDTGMNDSMNQSILLSPFLRTTDSRQMGAKREEAPLACPSPSSLPLPSCSSGRHAHIILPLAPVRSAVTKMGDHNTPLLDVAGAESSTYGSGHHALEEGHGHAHGHAERSSHGGHGHHGHSHGGGAAGGHHDDCCGGDHDDHHGEV